MCGGYFPLHELTCAFAASYLCLPCADWFEETLLDDDWWAENGPKGPIEPGEGEE